MSLASRRRSPANPVQAEKDTRAGRVSFLALAIGLVAALVLGLAPADARQRRNLLLYPPQRIALKMNHAHPAHRALRCARCHTDAMASRSANDRLIPAETSCLPCHADAIDRENASAATCGTCHVDFDESAPTRVTRSSFPTSRIRFAHGVHARAGVRCLECHDGVDEAGLATRDHLPTMDRCLSCHAENGVRGADECRECHLLREDGKLKSVFPDGTMNPPAWLHGMQHDRDFDVRHRWVGADHGDLCAACHTERDCEDCHDGRVPRETAYHPNDYLTLHTTDARRDSNRCTSCHATQTFCQECHARLGLSTISAPALARTDRYHPPSNVWVRGPVLHAREGRRSMTECTTCHVERDCVQCHGALGIGGGVSPHPPGFAGRCKRLLERNERACVTCHGDTTALEMRCR